MPIDPRDLARLNELLDALDEAEGRNDWTPTFLRFGIPAAAGVAGGLASLLSSGLALGPSIALGAGSAGLGEQLAQEYEHAYYGRERNPLQTAVQTGVGGFPLGRVGSLGSALAKNAALGATGTALTHAAEGQMPGVGDVAAGAALGGGVGGAFHLGFDALARLLGGRRLAALRTAAEPQGERYADLGQGPVETPKLTEAEATRAALEAARARAATELDVLRPGPSPYLSAIDAAQAQQYADLGIKEPPLVPHGPAGQTGLKPVARTPIAEARIQELLNVLDAAERGEVTLPLAQRRAMTTELEAWQKNEAVPWSEADAGAAADVGEQAAADQRIAQQQRVAARPQSGFPAYAARDRELQAALDAAEMPFRTQLRQFEQDAERAALQTPERQLPGATDSVFDQELGMGQWRLPYNIWTDDLLRPDTTPGEFPYTRFYQGEQATTDVTQPLIERQPTFPEQSLALVQGTETPPRTLGDETPDPLLGWMNIAEPPGTLKPGSMASIEIGEQMPPPSPPPEMPPVRPLDPVWTAEQGLPPERQREPGQVLSNMPVRTSWGVVEPDNVPPPTLPAGPEPPAALPPSPLAGLLGAAPPPVPPKWPSTRVNLINPRVRQDRFRPIGDLDQQMPPRVPPLPPEPSPPKPRRRGPRGQQGYINPQSLYPLGGALTGGAIGAPIGAAADEENRWRGAFVGGGLGALLGGTLGLRGANVKLPPYKPGLRANLLEPKVPDLGLTADEMDAAFTRRDIDLIQQAKTPEERHEIFRMLYGERRRWVDVRVDYEGTDLTPSQREDMVVQSLYRDYPNLLSPEDWLTARPAVTAGAEAPADELAARVDRSTPDAPIFADDMIPDDYFVQLRDAEDGMWRSGKFETMAHVFDVVDSDDFADARLIDGSGRIVWSMNGQDIGQHVNTASLTPKGQSGSQHETPSWSDEFPDGWRQETYNAETNTWEPLNLRTINDVVDLGISGDLPVRILMPNGEVYYETKALHPLRRPSSSPDDLPQTAPSTKVPFRYDVEVWDNEHQRYMPNVTDITTPAEAQRIAQELKDAGYDVRTTSHTGASQQKALPPSESQGSVRDAPYTYDTYNPNTGEWTREGEVYPNSAEATRAAQEAGIEPDSVWRPRKVTPEDAPPREEQINPAAGEGASQYYIEWRQPRSKFGSYNNDYGARAESPWVRLRGRIYDSTGEADDVATDLRQRGYEVRVRGEQPGFKHETPQGPVRFLQPDYETAMREPEPPPTRDLTPEEAAELRQLLEGAIEEGRKGTPPDPESQSWWDELLRGLGDNPPDPNDPNRGQGGFANPQALYPLAGGFAGGAIGAPLGAAADEESPARGALSGGLLGAMLGAGLGARGAARGGGKGSPSRPSTVSTGKPGTTPVPAPPSPEQPPKGKGIRRLWEATTQSSVPGRKPIPTDRRKQIGMDRLRHSPQLSEEIERDIDRMFEEHNAYAAARGGRQPDARTMALAQRIKVDMDKRQPERHRLNDEQTVAYASAMMTAAEKAEPLKKKMLAGQATDTDIIEFTRLLNQLGLVDATLSGSASEAGRVLRRQRYLTNVQPGDIVAAGAAARRALTNPKMQAALKLPFDDPDALGKLITASREHGFLRMGLGYYVNNILSGILTQERNLGGNTASLLNRALVKPMAVAGDVAVSAATGRPRQLYMGEVREELTGALSALHKAWQDAYYTMRYGHSVERIREMTETLGTKGTSADSVFEMEHVELPGGGMNPINWPSRMLDAGDRFFYQLNKGAEIHAQAYGRAMQNARKAGKAGDAAWVAQEAAKIRLDPPAEMIAAVREQARRGVYREQVPPAIAHLLAMKEHLPVLNLVIPFVRMPYNLMKQGIEHSPLGLLAKQGTSQRLMTSLVKGAAEGEERATAMGLGRVLEGTAALVPLAMYAAAGKISGAGPSDQNKKAALMRTGWRPNSFNVPLPEGVAKTLGASRSDDGTYWVPYQLFQPISQPLMLLANGFELWQEGQTFQDPAKLEKWAQTVGLRFANSSISQSFLSGLANFVGALEDPDRWAKQFVGGTATGFVPLSGALTTVQRATDKTIRETDTPLDVVRSRMPGLSKQLPPKLDVYGRDLQREESAWNALTPIGRKEDAVDAELRRLGITLAPPSDRLEFRLPRGRVARLTQQGEQETLARARGMSDRAALVRLMNSSSYRHAEDYEKQILVRRAMSRAGQQVTNRARAALRGGRAQDLERLLTPQQRDLASQ